MLGLTAGYQQVGVCKIVLCFRKNSPVLTMPAFIYSNDYKAEFSAAIISVFCQDKSLLFI